MKSEDKGSMQKAGGQVIGFIKSKVKSEVSSLALKLLGKCWWVILLIMAIVVTLIAAYGAVASYSDSLDDMILQNPELAGMSEEEQYAWINDPENIYDELKKSDSLLDLKNSNLVGVNKDMIVQIFDRLHAYDDRSRETSGQIKYGNRIETYTGTIDDRPSTIVMEEMDRFGTIASDNNSFFDGLADSVSYDTEYRTTEIYRSDVEGETDENGVGLFDTRWQPIFVVCAMAARNNVDNHELQDDQSFYDTEYNEISLDGYYLTDEQIDDIINIFAFEFEYYYDPITASRVTYGFKSFIKKPSAYRYTYETTSYYSYDTDANDLIDDSYSEFTRTTYRVPEAAPKEIHNSFVHYIYNYTDNVCTSRDYQVYPDELIAACEECCIDFDYDEFLELLAMLPGTDDLVEYYSSFVKTEAGYMPIIESTTDPDECRSIGVIYNPGNGLIGDTDADIGSTGQEGWVEWDGEVTDLIYYDYNNGDIHRIAVKVPGEDYGIYQVHSTATKSYLISDEVTVEQLVYLFDTDSTFSRCSNVLFSSDENKRKTAECLVQIQNENGLSVLFFLGIMKIEGAVGTAMGDHWNFFNIEASAQYGRPSIAGHARFADYTQLCADPWEALTREILAIRRWYSTNYNQNNAFLFIFAGYTEPDWSLIYHSYCPPWDDMAFPWAAGSGMGSPSGQGWANRVGDFRYGFEQAILNSGV